MYGWGSGGITRRAIGTADADNPSPETLERRRASDLAFINALRTCSEAELLRLRERSRGWRLVAIDRRLALFQKSP